MTRVKICGTVHDADRDVAVAADADAVGVISEVGVDTPRAVDRSTARDLLAGVPPLTTGVLVTMPSSVQSAVRLVEFVAPDAVQIHSTLDPGAIAVLNRRVDCRVLAATGADDPDLGAYASAADGLIVDAVDADGAGGTGDTLDWARTADLIGDLDAPVILAGGLTPANVGEAIRTVAPDGVDVATGVERADPADDEQPGRKSPRAVRQFVANAKRAGREVPA